jgi:hypothetical protein
MKQILIFLVAMLFVSCDDNNSNINNIGNIQDSDLKVPHPNPANSTDEFPPQTPEV